MIQINHLATVLHAIGTHQEPIILVKKEIVQHLLQTDLPDRELAAVVTDLPDLRHVLEGSDITAARRGLVDSTDARAVAIGVAHGDDFQGREILRIKQHQGIWQVVTDQQGLPSPAMATLRVLIPARTSATVSRL